MERTMMKDSGDGYRRADDGSHGKGPTAKTAAYTVKQTEAGTVFSNLGAGASVTFTLPVPKGGMWFGFVKEVKAQDIVLQAPSGVSINGGTAAEVYKNVTTTEHGTCTLIGLGATDYFVQAEKGTWENAAS